MHAQAVYRPQRDITGPAFSAWFKLLATLFNLALIGYVISFISAAARHHWPRI
jgi:hypothetical protein